MKKTVELHSETIKGCLKGDRKSQYRLYMQYSQAMYNICIRFIPDQMEAEDVLQEAFIKAFKNLQKFKGDSTFGAWLKRILINHCISFLRKSKPVFVEMNELPIDIMEEEDEVLTEFRPEIIHHAIKDLPEGSRVVFNLHMLEGYKHKEIAKMLDISESTSKSQYQRARMLLQEKLIRKVYAN